LPALPLLWFSELGETKETKGKILRGYITHGHDFSTSPTQMLINPKIKERIRKESGPKLTVLKTIIADVDVKRFTSDAEPANVWLMGYNGALGVRS
jgi:hypothetical protein